MIDILCSNCGKKIGERAEETNTSEKYMCAECVALLAAQKASEEETLVDENETAVGTEETQETQETTEAE